MSTRRSNSFRYLLVTLMVMLAALHGWQAQAQDEPAPCATQAQYLASLQPLLAAHNATRTYAMAAPDRFLPVCAPERASHD
jgi:hypothetical protein